MDIQTPLDTEKIRTLNDSFRRTGIGGVIVTTNTVAALPPAKKACLIAAVRIFSEFDEGNDPHAEHDFGSVTIEGDKFFWRIDYMDRSMEMGSPNPADPSVTKRVLTIMRADEY